jgi:hypothetical protein
MLPLIYEMWVLTYTSDKLRTELFNEQVYLEKLPAQKAMWYQNSKRKTNPKKPYISVMTVEDYAKARERESFNLGELRGQYPDPF